MAECASSVRSVVSVGLRLAVFVACFLSASCGQPSDPAGPGHASDMPPLDINTIEECQRADLQRYLGSTFRFHLYGCEADVTFDAVGKVLAFVPNDAALCARVIEGCRP